MNARTLTGLFLLGAAALLSFRLSVRRPGAAAAEMGGARNTAEPGSPFVGRTSAFEPARRELIATRESSQVPRAMLVQCQDPSSRPLADVKLSLQSDTEVLACATTAEDGGVLFEGRCLEQRPLIVQAELSGRVTMRRILPAARDSCVLRLRPGLSLHGLVECDGVPVGAGLTVVAIPAGEEHRTRPFERLVLHSGLPVGTTDHAGRFQLEGLDPDQLHRIVTGGLGWIQTDPPSVQPVQQDFITLEVEPASCLRLGFFEAPHQSIPLAEVLDNGTELQAIRLGHPGKLIAGQDLSGAFNLPTSFSLAPNELLFFAAGASESGAGHVRLSVELAGFEPAEFTLPLLPVNAEAQDIILAPRESWGELTLDIKAEAASGDTVRRIGPVARVHLLKEDRTRRTFFLDGPLLGRHTLSRVPRGTYSLLLESDPPSWFAQVDGAEPVSVGAEPGFATFTLHDLGEIRLEVLDSRGDEYQGALSVFLARSESRGAGAGELSGRMATFLRPPYALSALRRGSYSVVLVTPTSSRPPDLLQVWPGESTVQLMQLDDTR